MDYFVQIPRGPLLCEPETMAKMAKFMEREGFVDLVPTGGKNNSMRIYLSDPRSLLQRHMKTVLRIGCQEILRRLVWGTKSRIHK